MFTRHPIGFVVLFLLMALDYPSMGQENDDPEPRGYHNFILDDIQIETSDVFDSTTRIPIIGGIVEPLHAITKPKVVAQEIFRKPGDTVTQFDLDEIEKNLRNLEIFADIKITVVPSATEEYSEIPHATLKIRTQDSWSLRFSSSYNNGDYLSYGISLQEANFLGYGKVIGIGADYSNFNNRGWRYGMTYLNRNIFGSHIYLGGNAIVAESERSGYFAVGRPFFSDRTPYAFSSVISYYFGREISYFKSPTEVLTTSLPVHRTSLGGWYSTASEKSGSVFRAAISAQYNRTTRDTSLQFPRAFENSVWVFGGISSRRREYTRMTNVDMDGAVQVPVGGMGSVSIGKISPVHGGLDNVVYVGADARQAVRSGDLYGFASVEGGTGLAGKEAKFTTERVEARGAWLVHPGAFVARFEQSTVWNWQRYFALGLDNLGGLRGYRSGEIFGANRMQLNLEYRLNPIVRIWLFDIGSTAFYDLGSVWQQSEKIWDARFHSSVGFGLRFGNANASIDKGLLRIDLAYNVDEGKFSRLIISNQESFDFFGSLDYRPPAPYVY